MSQAKRFALWSVPLLMFILLARADIYIRFRRDEICRPEPNVHITMCAVLMIDGSYAFYGEEEGRPFRFRSFK